MYKNTRIFKFRILLEWRCNYIHPLRPTTHYDLHTHTHRVPADHSLPWTAGLCCSWWGPRVLVSCPHWIVALLSLPPPTPSLSLGYGESTLRRWTCSCWYPTDTQSCHVTQSIATVGNLCVWVGSIVPVLLQLHLEVGANGKLQIYLR